MKAKIITVGLLLLFFNVYLFLRERDRETETEREREAQEGKGQRERETQNLKQAPGSELSAQKPDLGLKLTDCEIMT